MISVINEAEIYYWQKILHVSKLPAASFIPVVSVFNSTVSSLLYTVNANTADFVILYPEYKNLYPLGITIVVP